MTDFAPPIDMKAVDAFYDTIKDRTRDQMTPGELARAVEFVRDLRLARDSGEISNRQFKQSKWGAICKKLWGADFFSKFRGKMTPMDQGNQGASA